MPQIIPYLYYEDAGPAIDFMEKAFGFEIVSVFSTQSAIREDSAGPLQEKPASRPTQDGVLGSRLPPHNGAPGSVN